MAFSLNLAAADVCVFVVACDELSWEDQGGAVPGLMEDGGSLLGDVPRIDRQIDN